MAGKINLLAACVFAAVLMSGCGTGAPRLIYHWNGSYETSLYEYLTEEGEPSAQISKLESLARKANDQGKKVPPGLYAHLGLLYANLGNGALANANFDKEAQLFPESRAFVEFLKKGGKR